MTQNLLSHHLDPEPMPLVFQYNKRDLPQVLETEALDRALNARHAETIPAVAIRGEGVLETFTAILAHTVQNLSTRYAILDISQGTPARQWAEDAAVAAVRGEDAAPRRAARQPEPRAAEAALRRRRAPRPRPGRARWRRAAPSPAAPRGRRYRAPADASTTVRAARLHRRSRLARAGARRLGPLDHASADARSNDLVETYAEASAQLGSALDELREERDAARQRLVDLRQTMKAAQDVLAGVPLDAAVEPVLETMARIARTERAAFWVPEPGRPPRAAALLGLAEDPLLGRPAALRHVFEVATRGHGPRVRPRERRRLRCSEALVTAEGTFASVLAAAFRTPRRRPGHCASSTTRPDTARPGRQRARAPRRDPARARGRPRAHGHPADDARRRACARAGARRLGVAARPRRRRALARGAAGEPRPDARPPRRAAVVPRAVRCRLAPALSSALEDGRSLLAFSRGEIRTRGVYVEDLLARAARPRNVTVDLDPAAELVVRRRDAPARRPARGRRRGARARRQQHHAARHPRRRVDGRRPHRRARDRRCPPRPCAARGTRLGPRRARLSLSLARRIAEMHGGALEDRRDRDRGRDRADPARGLTASAGLVLLLRRPAPAAATRTARTRGDRRRGLGRAGRAAPPARLVGCDGSSRRCLASAPSPRRPRRCRPRRSSAAVAFASALAASARRRRPRDRRPPRRRRRPDRAFPSPSADAASRGRGRLAGRRDSARGVPAPGAPPPRPRPPRRARPRSSTT